MKLVSARILITMAAENKHEVILGDIGNTNADNEENIYTHAIAKLNW